MTSGSLGTQINVKIREIDRVTGLVTNNLTGHNIITRTGLQVIADYISAHFNSGELLDLSNSEITANFNDLINDFKALLINLPYCVHLGTAGYDEEHHNEEKFSDTDVIQPLIDPVTHKKVILKLSNGASTIQSALMGSLQTLSVSGYTNGITISYTTLSDSTTFENFRSGANGILIDDDNNPIKLEELSLMNKDETKCWARISFPSDSGLILKKDRVYDVLWNINLVSIPTQLKELNE